METRVASYRFRAWPLYDAIPSTKSNSSGGCDSAEGTLIAKSATFYGDSNAKCETVSRSQPDFPRSDCGGNLVVFSILMDLDVLVIAFFFIMAVSFLVCIGYDQLCFSLISSLRSRKDIK